MLLKVSVITALYNAERYIAQTIESILSQIFHEMIIVNDGSTDRSMDIVRSFKDSRLVIIEQDNKGPAVARNKALRAARGDYIAVLDADDIAMSDRIEKQLSFLQHNTDIALVGSNAVLIDEIGKNIGETHFPNVHENVVRHLEEGKSMFPHSSFFLRTEAVRQIGGYNERYIKAQDKDLLLRFCQKYRIGCISEPLIALRLSLSSFGRSDSRHLQRKYDIAALINYFRRKNGMQDLSVASKEEWESFFNEVEQWFDIQGYGKKSDAKEYFRQFRLIIRRGRMLEAIQLLCLALKSNPLFFTYRNIGLTPATDLREFIERDF